MPAAAAKPIAAGGEQERQHGASAPSALTGAGPAAPADLHHQRAGVERRVDPGRRTGPARRGDRRDGRALEQIVGHRRPTAGRRGGQRDEPAGVGMVQREASRVGQGAQLARALRLLAAVRPVAHPSRHRADAAKPAAESTHNVVRVLRPRRPARRPPRCLRWRPARCPVRGAYSRFACEMLNAPPEQVQNCISAMVEITPDQCRGVQPGDPQAGRSAQNANVRAAAAAIHALSADRARSERDIGRAAAPRPRQPRRWRDTPAAGASPGGGQKQRVARSRAPRGCRPARTAPGTRR